MQPKKHTLPHAACLDNDIHGPARSRRREYGVPYAHGRPDQRYLHLGYQKPSAVLRSTHTPTFRMTVSEATTSKRTDVGVVVVAEAVLERCKE